MAEYKNQHYVPKHYFRLFNGGGNTIHFLNKKTGNVRLDIPIKGQCQKDYLYGGKEIEELLGKLDGQHAEIMRIFVEGFDQGDFSSISEKEIVCFHQFVSVQRSRTRMEAEKRKSTQEDLALFMFREHLKENADRDFFDKFDEALKNNQFTLYSDEAHILLTQISVALQCSVGISDLDLFFINNQSGHPFILGDSPIVYYNLYALDVKNRGVLGLQCPGLMIFVPLRPDLMILLVDVERYKITHEKHIITIFEKSVISQLNVLQLHHSKNTVYFSDQDHSGYIKNLWNAHSRKIRQPKARLNFNADFLVDGKKPKGQLIHGFEPQIDYRLDLPFIHTDPVSEQNYVFTPRDLELHRMMKENIRMD